MLLTGPGFTPSKAPRNFGKVTDEQGEAPGVSILVTTRPRRSARSSSRKDHYASASRARPLKSSLARWPGARAGGLLPRWQHPLDNRRADRLGRENTVTAQSPLVDVTSARRQPGTADLSERGDEPELLTVALLGSSALRPPDGTITIVVGDRRRRTAPSQDGGYNADDAGNQFRWAGANAARSRSGVPGLTSMCDAYTVGQRC